MIPREAVTMMARRRLVAEVRTETAIQALGVVDALAQAGIATIEVSLAIPGAQEILSHVATRTDVLVGAGAVLDERQARDAISCGARFIASPIMNPDLVAVCRDANAACILGAMTPTEIIAAQRAGAEMVKLFPAEAVGGPSYIRALYRQLSHMSLQISGGFPPEHLLEYLQLPIQTIAMGTLLVPRVLVERQNWAAITTRARAFVEFANNPHQYAARFLAMLGVGQPVAPRQGVPTVGHQPTAPQPVVTPQQAALANEPTAREGNPIPEEALSGLRGRGSRSGFEPSASGSGFKPWDSRPVELGDDEDWLR